MQSAITRILGVTLVATISASASRLSFGDDKPTAPQGRAIVDTFDDGVFAIDGVWERMHVQGGLTSDTIEFDEKTRAGLLTLRYLDDGDTQSTLLARTDAALATGQWVKVDVAIPAVQERAVVRAGMGIVSSRGRNPKMGLAQRENLIVWGLRADGLARGHWYGPGGKELGSTPEGGAMRLGNYRAGQFYTFLIARSGPREFELRFARSGGKWIYAGHVRLPENADAPTIPGIFLDPGNAPHIVLVDNFEVGSGRPIPPPPTRADAPRLPVPETPRGENEIALILPDRIEDLSRLRVTHHIVNMPAGRDNAPGVRGPAPTSAPKGFEKWTCHHGAEIEWFRDRLFVTWHATEEHEHPRMRAFLSWSENGEDWSTPLDLAESTVDGSDELYLQGLMKRYNRPREKTPYRFAVVPRCLHATPDRLYLWTLADVNGSGDARVFYTEDARVWHEMPYGELDRLEVEKGLTVRANASNRGFARLANGGLLAGHLGPRRGDGFQFCAPTTDDPTGLTGWGLDDGWIDTSRCGDVGEPGVYQGLDGVLHLTIRGPSNHVWHACSRNDGKTWSILKPQPHFPDFPGNKKFGRFPNGWIYYVGNPVGSTRVPLALGISKDGWTFDQVYAVRHKLVKSLWPHRLKNFGVEGYEYPTATYRDGWLYVAYSHARDYIEVTKVDLSQIHRTAFRE